ncbi:myosin-binding protein 7-like [Hordeum vulgare]|nr:myosin-binding protein 7-like [Hordeum vulgare]
MRCGWRRRRRSRRCRRRWRRRRAPQGEVEEERLAAARAAREVMDMMLRLQREKDEVKMELRQFRRFADEKMALDAAEIDHLRALVARRARHLACARSRLHAYQQTSCLCLVILLPDADDSERQDHNDGQEGGEEDAMGWIWSAGSASSSTARMGIY